MEAQLQLSSLSAKGSRAADAEAETEEAAAKLYDERRRLSELERVSVPPDMRALWGPPGCMDALASAVGVAHLMTVCVGTVLAPVAQAA